MIKLPEKPKLSIPVLFQRMGYTADKRFLRVKLWFMHTGDNLNGSHFTKESIEAAIPTLANIPILGFIRDKGDGSQDFAGHEERLVIKRDGEPELVYYGSAYGVIPESNNARFETRLCDDGEEREFLVVDGLMWSKFKNATRILTADGVRPHSMELSEDYEGEFDDRGVFVFKRFAFEGACILGVDVEPAMINSSIEVQTSFSKSIASQVATILKEYENSLRSEGNSGGKEGDDGDGKTPEGLDALFSELKNLISIVDGSDEVVNEIFNSLYKIEKLLTGGDSQ